jgi:uncharacterized membrane protein (DUF106 family)
MEKQNESMRDRLLARLPQAGESCGLPGGTTLLFLLVLGIYGSFVFGVVKVHNPSDLCDLETVGCILLVGGILTGVFLNIEKSRVCLLKEIKQVQLQVLELQVSLQKPDNE